MSLKSFHIGFITVALLLGIFLVSYGFQTLEAFPNQSKLLLGSGIFTIIALVPYALWFIKKSKSLALLIFVVATTYSLFSTSLASACSVCFGDPNSLSAKGTKMGVIFLMIVVVSVLMGILGIGISWSKRSRLLSQ